MHLHSCPREHFLCSALHEEQRYTGRSQPHGLEISLNPPNGPFVSSTRLSEDVALEVLALEQGCRNEHWIWSLRSRTLFELSDLDSLVVAPTASPGTEPFHWLVNFRPDKEKRKGKQPMERMRGAREGDDRKTKEP